MEGRTRSTNLKGVLGIGAVNGDGLAGSTGDAVGLVKRAGCVGGLRRLVGAWIIGKVDVGGCGNDGRGSVVVVLGLLQKLLGPGALRLGSIGAGGAREGKLGC